MIIGIPTEIKNNENRVGLTPRYVGELVKAGHEVLVQSNAGLGIFASNEDYQVVGAKILPDAKTVFDQAEMIVKIKEPQPSECAMLSKNQIIFTYLHLAPDPVQARGLIDSGCIAIAYETITGEDGKGLPLLQPMSEVAGRMAPLMGSVYAAKHFGGRGHLISGVKGTPSQEVLILGGGTAGFNAAQIAVGMMGKVTILEISDERIAELQGYFGNKALIIKSTEATIKSLLPNADMVIGAVLIPGASAPKLVKRKHLKIMKPSALMVDIAIDQGGCFETSRPTTHENPVYMEEGIMHYCVANMPGAYPLTATEALNQATFPYILELANKGWKQALRNDDGFAAGLNVKNGEITHKAVADALKMDYKPVSFDD
jgi:alanine dehydrogenase